MRRFFSLDMPGTQFVRNVLLFTLVGLLPVLSLYVFLSPGFSSALLESGLALRRFLRQVLINGLPVVFVTNYVGFFLFALSHGITTKSRDPAVYILIDLPVRVAIFLALHAIIYVLSADWFGSFGGNRMTALRVVAPTLARSALFENVSGVYLYATLVSALPLYISVIKQSRWLQPLASQVPFKSGSLLLACLCFALAVFFLTTIANIMVRLQS